MIRPHRFSPNQATEADNAFQARDPSRLPDAIARAAHDEVSRMAETLAAHGVTVHLFEDETAGRPDAVFPNNWFSTHAGGHVAIYPMFSASRQRERRDDVIEMLKDRYRVQDVIDYSGLERDGVYLEGTGAMVLDHVDRVAYAARSNRADPVALERFCTHFNFGPMAFDARDTDGRRIYHTNVMMAVCTGFALVGLDTITDEARRTEVRDRLLASERTVVALSQGQVAAFAGNAIELRGGDGLLLAVSSRALRALSPEQVVAIGRHARIVPLDVPTIELAGGSVRCMLAGIHLAPRPAS